MMLSIYSTERGEHRGAEAEHAARVLTAQDEMTKIC
jgi:hypothetical protein